MPDPKSTGLPDFSPAGTPDSCPDTIEDMSTLQERLSEAMAGPPKIKQAALAKACGLTLSSVNDWTRGKTRKIEGANLLAAARYLGVTPEWLATGRGPMRPLNRTGTQEIVSPVPLAESRLARLDHATFTQAKRWVTAEEVLVGAYPRDELVDQVFAVYDLMAESGGTLTAEQREQRFNAATARRTRGLDNDNADEEQRNNQAT